MTQEIEPGSLRDVGIKPFQVSEERAKYYAQAADFFKDQGVTLKTISEEFPDGRKATKGNVVMELVAGKMVGKMKPFYDKVDQLHAEAKAKAETQQTT